MALHFLHRAGALVVTLLAVWTVAQVWLRHSDRYVRRLTLVLAALLVLQLLLGATIIWTGRGLAVTTAHVVNAALLVATTTLLTLRAWRLEAPMGSGVKATS